MEPSDQYGSNPNPPHQSFSWLKFVLIGCGSLIGIFVVSILGLLIWAASLPEGGVKLSNELESFEEEHIEQAQILTPGEEVLAYYDATLNLTGEDLIVLTQQRVIHFKEGKTTAMDLKHVTTINHRSEGLIGDVIEIADDNGKLMKLEIAPLNDGPTFKSALEAAWAQARSQP